MREIAVSTEPENEGQALKTGKTVELTADVVRQMGIEMCRPQGRFTTRLADQKCFLAGGPARILLSVPAGGHYFRLDRTSARELRFFHSSPGTGTRVATISLCDLPPFDEATICLHWSPERLLFQCVPGYEGAPTLAAHGEASSTGFQVSSNGGLLQTGGGAVHVSSSFVQRGDDRVIEPEALASWKGTIEAIDILWTGVSDRGYLFEVVQVGATLSMLVTGLELYAKTRMIEIASEGIAPNSARLFHALASTAERKAMDLEQLTPKADPADRVRVLVEVIRTLRVNFQNYKQIKVAYRAAYGIKLGEIGLDSTVLADVQTFIRYRHHIVHGFPLFGILNRDRIATEEMVVANRKLAMRAVACLSKVVEALHSATLGLRPPQ